MIITKIVRNRTKIIKITGAMLVFFLLINVHGYLYSSVKTFGYFLSLFLILTLSCLVGFLSNLKDQKGIERLSSIEGLMRKKTYSSENIFSYAGLNDGKLASQIAQMSRFFCAINYELDSEKQVSGALKYLHEYLPANIILYFRFDKEQIEYVQGVKPSEGTFNARVHPNSGLVEDTISAIQSEIELPALFREERIYGLLPFKRPQNEDKFLFVPVEYASLLYGLIVVISPEQQGFKLNDKKLISEFAINFALLCQNNRIADYKKSNMSEIAEKNVINLLRENLLQEHPPIFNTWEIAHEYMPASEPGGDFYFYSELPDKSIYVIIGKASSSGLKAAMFIAELKILIAAKKNEMLSPADLLNYLSSWLANSDLFDTFATLVVLKIKMNDRKVIIASAGAPIPLVNRPKSGYSEFPKIESGIPMGLLSNQDGVYSDHVIEMLPGDGIFLFTDGVTELNDSNNGRISSAEMKIMFDKIPDEPAVVLLDSVMKIIRQSHIGSIDEDQTAIYLKVE